MQLSAKKRRQQVLLSLIAKKQLSTQQELVENMAKLKVFATQSSVSRDLEELGIVKIHGHYAAPAAAKAFGPRGILQLEAAGDAMLVAKCESGHASAVTVAIDRASLPEVVGTIAGDDTIFIAVRGKSAQKTAFEKIRALFLMGDT